MLGFCLLLLWRDPLLFFNDDYQLSILPVFADVARSWSEGHLPLLSPYSWVCSNLAGEFQYGTFSVFVNAAVVLIWKLPLTFPQQAAALSISHLGALATGCFVLARGRKLALPLALLVALVGTLNGWIICWGATDWFGALGAFAWLPWAWWGLERTLDRDRSRFRFLWPAPFIYLLITGGFPYTVVMLVVLIAWLSLRSLAQTRTLSNIWPLVIGASLGAGLAAPAWLALFDYLAGSVRQAQESSAHYQWIIPFQALPGFFLPCWTVRWADFSTRLMPHNAVELGCGLVPPVALVCGLFQHSGAFIRRMKWELGLLASLLLFSMLPSTSVFRWSFRWLPFIHLILVLCAAEVFQGIRSRQSGHSSNGLRGWFGSVAVLLVAGTMTLMVVTRCFDERAFPYAWYLLGLALAWAVLDFFVPIKMRSWLPPAVALLALLVTYFCIPANCGVPKYNLDQRLTQAAPLDPQRLYLSVHPPPESAFRLEEKPEPFGTTVRPGSTSMWGGVRFINGYSPIRPAGVAREFDFAIHGEIADWAGDYLLGWQAGPEGELARLGVDGIIVASELTQTPQPKEEWVLAISTDEGRVYHRRGKAFPLVRAVPWLEREFLNGDKGSGMIAHERVDDAIAFAEVSVSGIRHTRNFVHADVRVTPGELPGLVAFSRPFFGGYVASLDGKPVPVSSYRGLVPVVQLPGGASGRLVLQFQPWWLQTGALIAVLSVLIWAGSAMSALFRNDARP